MSVTVPAVVGIMQVQEQRRAAADARETNAQSLSLQKEAADKAEQAQNKANQKRPDYNAMLYANQQAAGAGGASTMVSGAGAGNLSLGKNTLLG